MTPRKTLLAVAGVIALFMALVATVVYLAAAKIVSFEAALLMLIALFGFYVGYGFLIAVYRFVKTLD
jgi:hypothetical protein